MHNDLRIRPIGRAITTLTFALVVAVGLSRTLAAQTQIKDQAPATPPPPAEQESADHWHPESFTLANGMEVVVLPDHRAPVVTHMVWYKIGAADEPPGESGIAHFLEHLMFRGTKRVPPGDFSKIVARNGGQDNAFTTYDYTAYFQRVAVDRLPLVMQLEADRMVNLDLPDEIVLPERDVILEERSERTDNDPGALFGEQMNAAQFMNAPYGKPIIGWEQEMRHLTRADAVAFYRKYYAPNNAVLIVAGDITADKLKPLAEKYYGSIPARDVPPRDRPKEPAHLAAIRMTMRDGRVHQPSFTRTYIAPSYATSKDNDAVALDVLAELLGGGSTSRLYRKLVVEQGLAVSAGDWYSGSNLDYGQFSLYGTPRGATTLPQLEKATDAVIGDLLKNGVTPEELALAKETLISDSIYARDSQFAMARIYGVALTTGLTIKDVVTYPDQVRAVTAEQVQAAAEKLFNSLANVTGYLEPEPAS